VREVLLNSIKVVYVLTPLEEDGTRSGPFRVWMKGKGYPGLAMSRTIGDLIASEVGVIAEPEIIEHTITKDCKFIVIATDGVWEFLNNERVCEVVHPFYLNNDSKGACDKLYQLSAEWWEKVSAV
jgi:serine/threonine protein phosphatase PrpC